MSQSFFRGVILWGGIGIRLISDLRVDFSAPGATGGKANAEVEVFSDKTVGSVSIMSSSSAFGVDIIIVGSASTSMDEGPAAARVDKVMSVSSSSLSRCCRWDGEE